MELTSLPPGPWPLALLCHKMVQEGHDWVTWSGSFVAGEQKVTLWSCRRAERGLRTTRLDTECLLSECIAST